MKIANLTNKILISVLLTSALAGFAPHASAASRADGSLVLDKGTVYVVENGTRRPFRSPEVFYSQGYDFSQVDTAVAEDLALPEGPVTVYKDGTLIKGPNKPLVYLVTNGQKRGFESAQDFHAYGFSFSNVVTANPETFADLPDGQIINVSKIAVPVAHPAGTLINDNGTVYEVTHVGKKAFTSEDDFYSYGHSFKRVVPANTADTKLPAEPPFQRRIMPKFHCHTVINQKVVFVCPPIRPNDLEVISPNGGETWILGATQRISWQDNRLFPMPLMACPKEGDCVAPAPRNYDIMLSHYYPPCTEYVCPMMPYPAPYTIAKNVSGTSYSWNGTYFIQDAGRSVTDGSYTIQICESGTSICDSSDSYFRIISGISTGNLPPVVNSISGPTVLATGETGRWKITASDPENGSLSYRVDWGDQSGEGTIPSMNESSAMYKQDAGLAHAYTAPGNHTVTFTVTDDKGLSAESTISVYVIAPTN